MKLEIELDDSIYGKIEEIMSGIGLDAKSFIEKAVTQTIIEMATHPEESDEAMKLISNLETFKRMGEEVFKRNESSTP